MNKKLKDGDTEKMAELRQTGMSYKGIADIFGVSKQYAYKIANKYKSLRENVISKIKKRDNYTCQKCHVVGKKILDVHHIDKNCHNNIDTNLITLCRQCHKMVHNGLTKL